MSDLMGISIKTVKKNILRVHSKETSFEVETGIEFADSKLFFTLFEKHRRVTVFETIKKTENEFIGKAELKPQNKFDISKNIEIKENVLTQKQTIKTIQNGELLDFVSRFVFPKKIFTTALINNKKIKHAGLNIYHQYPVDHVRMKGDNISLDIYASVTKTPEWKQFAYVRDEPDSWVVHVRLLPVRKTRTIIKLNTRWYNKRIHALPERMILLLFPNRLLYKGERKRAWNTMEKVLYWLLPLSAYKIGKLPKGKKLTIETTLKISLSSKQ